MSPETGLSVDPLIDRGGRLRGDVASLPLPDRVSSQGVGNLAGEIVMSGLHRFLVTASFAVLCAPSGAGAEIPASEPTDNIIVTASRAPLAQAEVGSATTVIDRAQIDARQARYVTDLLRSVPGFAVSRSGPNGAQTQVRVRGAEANHVLVLIDGVRANDPASGDEFRWEYLSTSDIERIEIVRGPQSSLWGSDAVAAVVHVITRSGEKRYGISAYAEGGSQDTVNAALRGSTGRDRWNLGFDIERLDSGGSNIARSGTEADGAE
ncbi:MAG: TonB-dependent receptor, partial [Woeseiaceae bacterium]